MYIYIYSKLNIYIYIYKLTTYECIHIFTYIYMYIYICRFVNTYACLSTCHSQMKTHTCSHTHIHIHPFTHTHQCWHARRNTYTYPYIQERLFTFTHSFTHSYTHNELGQTSDMRCARQEPSLTHTSSGFVCSTARPRFVWQAGGWAKRLLCQGARSAEAVAERLLRNKLRQCVTFSTWLGVYRFKIWGQS